MTGLNLHPRPNPLFQYIVLFVRCAVSIVQSIETLTAELVDASSKDSKVSVSSTPEDGRVLDGLVIAVG